MPTGVALFAAKSIAHVWHWCLLSFAIWAVVHLVLINLDITTVAAGWNDFLINLYDNLQNDLYNNFAWQADLWSLRAHSNTYQPSLSAVKCKCRCNACTRAALAVGGWCLVVVIDTALPDIIITTVMSKLWLNIILISPTNNHIVCCRIHPNSISEFC